MPAFTPIEASELTFNPEEDVVASGVAPKSVTSYCDDGPALPLAREPALRSGRTLNVDTMPNLEALLLYTRGEIMEMPCAHCGNDQGPFPHCVVLTGHANGVCAGCRYNASGSRCSFHDNNLFDPSGRPPSSMSASAASTPTKARKGKNIDSMSAAGPSQDDMLSDDDAVEVIRLMAENAKLKDENRALQAKLDNMRGLLRAALGYMEA
ncbi:hypothetical protein ACJ73_02833 [Blastomyces percursus]|uniref:Uncharacterized protein n=1 Tax=Blastomyces percursus TaxID=1658174 RepID=A0A1J9RBA1_9EURO|nr:hypothetical protein ACJ73_02833 [Blastomyces percursus]